MYAIVLVKGKQYRIQPGEEFVVDKLNANEGDIVTIDKVMAVSGDGEYLFGSDAAQAKVKAKVVEHFRGEKITVQKYKRRDRYRRTLGHKQQLTRLSVEEISAPGIKKSAKNLEKVEKDQKDKKQAKTPAKKATNKKATSKNTGKRVK